MAEMMTLENLFGDIAIGLRMLSREQIDRALVVQELILSRTRIHTPIGKILMEMGTLTQNQIEEILMVQNNPVSNGGDGGCNKIPHPLAETHFNLEDRKKELNITISKDKMSACISPNGVQSVDLTLGNVKSLLAERGVICGLAKDSVIEQYLSIKPLPEEPFNVANGVPPTPGKKQELIYHFDIDSLRIGTLLDDNTMDWKDRGPIPQVKAGDLLVEKTKGDPGRPGTTVNGKMLPPPRMGPVKLKSGKGTKRSEDGTQILSKIAGTPKLCSDGKVSVFSVLNLDGDIGLETGHIDFDGHIETTGAVTTGYRVKGKGLRTSEIQNASVEVEEDLECLGGIYGSTIKVGGSMKASHIHNCTIEVLGELVVEKEIHDSTIETNGRCLIVDGKLINVEIDAKKGIYAKKIGSNGSTPCKLTVGFDRKYEREMDGYRNKINEAERQIDESETTLRQLEKNLETIRSEMRMYTPEQEKYLCQKLLFEAQLRGEGPHQINVKDEDTCFMLEEMIAELAEKNGVFKAELNAMMAEQEKVLAQMADVEKHLEMLADQIESTEKNMEVIELSKKFDPGIPVIKVYGTIFEKTRIITPHKETIVPKNLKNVRIAETKRENTWNKFKIKITDL